MRKAGTMKISAPTVVDEGVLLHEHGGGHAEHAQYGDDGAVPGLESLLSKQQMMSPTQPSTCMLGNTFVGVSAAQMMESIQVQRSVASTPWGRRCWPLGMSTSSSNVAERVNML